MIFVKCATSIGVAHRNYHFFVEDIYQLSIALAMQSPNTPKYPLKSLLIFSLSVFVFMFIVLANTTNMYSFKITGALFEILWLPVLALTYALPVYILFLFVKNKYHFKPLHLFSLFVLVSAITFMVLYN